MRRQVTDPQGRRGTFGIHSRTDGRVRTRGFCFEWGMPPIPIVPEALRRRPFNIREAAKLGLTERRLRGKSWRRLFPRVWVNAGHVMSDLDWIAAATCAMPDRAQLSHVSRIQALGLDFGPLRPFHFTVAGDLHIDLDDIYLHRTEVLPPLDDVGVTPAAAFIQYCAAARMIDAIKVGDWLLHHRHMTMLEVGELSHHHRWRPGARQVRHVLSYLDGASRSLKESETRALVMFSGLPAPEVNVDLEVGGRHLGCVDLLFRLWLLVLEYEGRQHAETVQQFQIDITRYAGFRDASVAYLQITNEMLQQPRALLLRIHRMLVDRGYDGPALVFAGRWASLFEPIGARPRSRAVV